MDPIPKCCKPCNPYNGVARRCRTASVNKGYIDERWGTNERRARCKRRHRQMLKCTAHQHRKWFKLNIPQLPLNKTFCAPAALTRDLPCSVFGYNQASAAQNTLFPVRYPTREERLCSE